MERVKDVGEGGRGEGRRMGRREGGGGGGDCRLILRQFLEGPLAVEKYI